MIEYIGRTSHTAELWRINGIEVQLLHKTGHKTEETERIIQSVETYLTEELYRSGSCLLTDAFLYLGGLPFVRVCMAFKDMFLACYAYFAESWAEDWRRGKERLHSKDIGYFYVFRRMLESKGPVVYDFRYLLEGTEWGPLFCEINDRAFAEVWGPLVHAKAEAGESLSDIAYRVGHIRAWEYLKGTGSADEYLTRLTHAFTERREKLSMAKLYHAIFGEGTKQEQEITDRDPLFRECFYREEAVQLETLPQGNRAVIRSDSDMWILYEARGKELLSLTLDFGAIPEAGMRQEVRSYYRYRFTGSIPIRDRSLGMLTRAICLMKEHNSAIHFFADITVADVKALQTKLENESIAQTSITGTISLCRTVIAYLTGSFREDGLKTPVPRSNPFDRLRFVNSGNYAKSTPYIPDSVMERMNAVRDELDSQDRLLFRLMAETGMRAKEAAMLEEDCLSDARYDGWVCLSYIPYKTLKARRANAIPDRHKVYISPDLASEIREYADSTLPLREEYDLPYIFLKQKHGRISSMVNMSDFALRINRLIREHDIRDDTGALWTYTNRQCRKTLVVGMIENHATTDELVYQLGHLSRSTVAKYYAEVRTVRLAELNSKFFRDKFDALITADQLTEFTEEERRQLYVDFRLGLRRVEMGLCLRKDSASPCVNTASMIHCASCPKLCTGKKYLAHWKELLASADQALGRLEEGYIREGLTDYREYAEYIREKNLADAYRNLTERLEGGDEA